MRSLFILVSVVLGLSDVASAVCTDSEYPDIAYVYQVCATQTPHNCGTVDNPNWHPYQVYEAPYGTDSHIVGCAFKNCITGEINWYWAAIAMVIPPQCRSHLVPKPSTPNHDAPKCSQGSVINSSAQTFSDAVPVVSTGFDLVYSSSMSVGYREGMTLKIPLTESTSLSAVTGYHVDVKLAGVSKFNNDYSNSPGQVVSYEWDGLGNDGLRQLGPTRFQVTVVETATNYVQPINTDFPLGIVWAKQLGIGGWVPSTWRFYSVDSGKVYYPQGHYRPAMATLIQNENLYRVADRDNRQVDYFDSLGRLVKSQTYMTGQTIRSFTYNPNGTLNSIQESHGRTTQFLRNTNGTLQSIVAPNGVVTTIDIDSAGNLYRVIAPSGGQYQMFYSATDMLAQLVDPDGFSKTIAYDNLGKFISETHAGGRSLAVTKNGNVTAVTSGLGRTTLTTETKYISSDAYIDRTLAPSGDTYTRYVGPNSLSVSGIRNWFEIHTADDVRFGKESKYRTSYSTDVIGGRVELYSESTIPSDVDAFSYTTFNRSTVVGNGTVNWSFNPATRVGSTLTTQGRTSQVTYDSFERPLAIQVGAETPLNLTYQNENLSRIQQGARQTNFQYDPQSRRLSSVTNALGQTSSYAYNSDGRLMSWATPDGRIFQQSYDGRGNITSVTPAGRPSYILQWGPESRASSYIEPSLAGLISPTTTMAYDADSMLTQVTRASGQNIHYQYNGSTGNLTSVQSPSGTLGYTYYGGSISRVNGPDSISVGIGYRFEGITSFWYYVNNASSYAMGYYREATDSQGKVSRETLTGKNNTSRQINYTYDADEALAATDKMTFTYQYPEGHLSGSTIGVVTDTYTYNSFGEVTGYSAKISGEEVYAYTLMRDELGRVASKSENLQVSTRAHSYEYDSSGRLQAVKRGGQLVSSYSYDTNGNRISGLVNGVSQSASYDNQDRLIAYNTKNYAYTADGELSSVTNTVTGAVTSYARNGFSFLKEVSSPNKVIGYEMNGFGQRVVVKKNGVVIRYWLYDPLGRLKAEFNADQTLYRTYVYGSKSQVPDYFVDGQGVGHRIISDHLGSVRVVINSETGKIEQRLEHDEFGRVLRDTNSCYQPFGFAGGLYDGDTGLVHFGVRDYDPETGRWTSKDPILFGGGDTNLYGYVANDPINFIDPEGTVPVPLILGILAGVFYATDTDTPGAAQSEMIGVPMAVAGGWTAGGGVCKATNTSVQFRTYPNAGGGGVGLYRNAPLPGQSSNIIRFDLHRIPQGGQQVYRPHVDIPGVVKHWPWGK